MYDRNEMLDRLLRHLGHVSWLALLYQYKDTHLLVMDPDLIEKIHAARKFELKCKTATPENFRDRITPNIKHILVFCPRGELAIVRELARDYPDITITSGTYGHILFGPEKQARLTPFKLNRKPSKPTRPIVILSAPSADAEFIARSLEVNGGAVFHEYFSRPYASWLSICEDFQISRLLDAALSRFIKTGDLRMVLQLDTLEALFRHTPVTPRHFVQYLEKNNAKVLVVKRRDWMMQSVHGQLLDRSVERSVWTKKPNRAMTVAFNSADFVGCLKRYDALPTQEAFLDQVVQASIESETIYLEDFMQDQMAMLPKLAAFLEVSLGENLQVLDYREGFEEAENFPPAVTQFRSEYLDRTGYHVTNWA